MQDQTASSRSTGGRPTRRGRLLRWLPFMVVAAEIALTATGAIGLRDALLAFLVVEGVLAVVLLGEATALARAFRAARREGADRLDAVVTALRTVLPRPVATAVINEVRVFHVLYVALRRRRGTIPGAEPIRYGQGLRPFLIAMLLLGILEAAVFELVLPWEVVRVVVLVVNVYGFLWLLAVILAFRVMPHEAARDRLVLRYATWVELKVPGALISDVRARRTRGHKRTVEADGDTLTVSVQGTTNVEAELREPWTAPVDADHRVRRVCFHADRVDEAVRTLRRAFGEQPLNR